MNIKKRKPIKIHSSFDEMREYGQQYSRTLDSAGCLAEMHRLNCKVFGENYGEKVSKTVEIYVALPEEDVNQFYRRINKDI